MIEWSSAKMVQIMPIGGKGVLSGGLFSSIGLLQRLFKVCPEKEKGLLQGAYRLKIVLSNTQGLQP